MAGYVILYKYTQQSMSDIKTGSQQIAAAKDLIKQYGGRLVGIWVTMGAYDGVMIVDAPDDHAMAATLLAIEMRGIASTQTMRAFSEDEIVQILAKLQ